MSEEIPWKVKLVVMMDKGKNGINFNERYIYIYER
jgi:hypothetical protein